MSMSNPARLFRLQTHFGTRVYLDFQERLRHGPIDGNLDNIWAQTANAQLVLWHDTGMAGVHGLSFPRTPDGALIRPIDGQDGSEVVMGEPQVFDIESAGPVIGLRHQHTYLCSEPDGRVVCNREVFGAWERFTLVEVEPAPPPVTGEEVRIEELTLEPLAHTEPATIDAADIERPQPAAWRNQAITEAETHPPSVAQAERLAASVAAIRAIPPPPQGVWQRLMRLLFDR